MKVTTKFDPSYTVAYCVLDYGEGVFVERGAMAWMSAGLKVTAGIGGNVVKAALRSAVGQESFLWAKYTATVQGAWLAVAPRYPGDITVIDVAADGPRLRSQTGSLLAASDTLDVSVRAGSLSTTLLREGAALVETSGSGQVVIGSYGAIEQFSLAPGEVLHVDSGHLVAWEATVNVRASTLQGVTTSVLSGEGLVAEVTGPGRLWAQTRAETQLRSWLMPERGVNER